MAPAAARFHGDPTARAARRRHHRHERQDDDRVPRARAARGRRAAHRPARHGRRRSSAATSAPVDAHDARGDRPAARRSRAMLDAGDAACVMEVSSHALELRRADAIHWAVAVFTNLTQDHLDFHPTMEDYFAAKRAAVRGRRRRCAVVNVDDPYGRRAGGRARRRVTVGIGARTPTCARPTCARDFAGSTLRARRASSCASPLPGRFNVLNALGAVAAARALGVDRRRRSPRRCRAPRRVPGASSRSTRARTSRVLVDYAHTPDSLENVLRAARELTRGPRDRVFGCGGDRDRGKRPLMGAIAARDWPTSRSSPPTTRAPRTRRRSSPRSSPGAGDGAAARRGDRRPPRGDRARASELARAGDVVVIAGKGHEQGQEFAGGRKVPFDDVDGRARGAACALAR